MKSDTLKEFSIDELVNELERRGLKRVNLLNEDHILQFIESVGDREEALVITSPDNRATYIVHGKLDTSLRITFIDDRLSLRERLYPLNVRKLTKQAWENLYYGKPNEP